MQKMPLFTALWINVCCIILSGCVASNAKEKVFGDDMSTLQQIHSRKFAHQHALDASAVRQRPVGDKDRDLVGSAKDNYQQLNARFPLLHNPVLMTYVYPHLTQAGTPIPGYVTYFKLYQTDHLALPGELSEKTNAEKQRQNNRKEINKS